MVQRSQGAKDPVQLSGDVLQSVGQVLDLVELGELDIWFQIN